MTKKASKKESEKPYILGNKPVSLFCNEDEEKKANFFITGQKGSGVSSVASAFAGIKPESDPLSTNGVQNWFFQKGLSRSFCFSDKTIIELNKKFFICIFT